MGIILSIIKAMFTPVFFSKAVSQGMPLLLGATGEIITEKAGHLNLGIPGIMHTN